jgi:hypothetical protein
MIDMGLPPETIMGRKSMIVNKPEKAGRWAPAAAHRAGIAIALPSPGEVRDGCRMALCSK